MKDDSDISGKLVTVYEGRGQRDSDFGNPPWYTVGYFLTEEAAVAAVKTKGNWGSPGRVISVMVLKTAGDEYYLLKEISVISFSPEEALKKTREQALAKLTSEERKALGL